MTTAAAGAGLRGNPPGGVLAAGWRALTGTRGTNQLPEMGRQREWAS